MTDRLTPMILTGSATLAGALLGVALTAGFVDDVPEQVNVSIVYDQHGEAVDVDLTDQNGEYIPAGSIAESWPADDNTDAEEN